MNGRRPSRAHLESNIEDGPLKGPYIVPRTLEGRPSIDDGLVATLNEFLLAIAPLHLTQRLTRVLPFVS